MTTKQTVTGQRLNAWNMSDGSVEIHAVGCSHKPGSGRNAKARFQDQVEFGKTEWTSQFAFAHDYWDNGILEEHEAENGVGSFDVFVEMEFKPCVKLPRNPVVDGNDKPAKAKTATRSTSDGSVALRAKARRCLYNSMIANVDKTKDTDLRDMMLAQAARVAHMFDMDAKFAEDFPAK